MALALYLYTPKMYFVLYDNHLFFMYILFYNHYMHPPLPQKHVSVKRVEANVYSKPPPYYVLLFFIFDTVNDTVNRFNRLDRYIGIT
jgi:hypothetical protein